MDTFMSEAIILETALWQIAISAYLVAIALDEIDFLTLLGGIAERRFHLLHRHASPRMLAGRFGHRGRRLQLVCVDERGAQRKATQAA